MTSTIKIVTTCLFVAALINVGAGEQLKSVLYTNPPGVLHPTSKMNNGDEYVSIYFDDNDSGDWVLETVTTNKLPHIAIKSKKGTYLYAADGNHKYDEERRNVFLSEMTDKGLKKNKEYLWDFLDVASDDKLDKDNLSGKIARIRNVLYKDEYLLAGSEVHTIQGNPRVFTGQKYKGQKGTNMKWTVE